MTEKEMNKQIEMMQKYYFKEKVDLLNAMNLSKLSIIQI